MYSCTGTSTGSRYLQLYLGTYVYEYLYICMHARSENLHASARSAQQPTITAVLVVCILSTGSSFASTSNCYIYYE